MERAIHLGVGAASIIIIIMIMTLYDGMTRSTESSHQVSHTLEVLNAINNIEAEFSGAEAAQWNYFFSGNEAYLPEREQSLIDLNKDITNLKFLTNHTSIQKKQADELERVATDYTKFLNNALKIYQAGDLKGAGAQARKAIAQHERIKFFELSNKIEQDELDHLKEYQEAEHAHSKKMMWIFWRC